ncbi:nucleotidyltransferase domain-containing protein [Paractinoplanes durhamensis]|uniref:nucleotidyltransferase domain-containing protein n=1 Tax=Paractinoplanes durhamensis TaxID=113563 RepID=UPI00362BEFC7
MRLRDVIERRWSAEVQAIGVHGSLAHGDDRDGSDVNVLVVTYRAGAGPKPALRKVDGTLVDLEVVTGDEGLRRARELTSRWPLDADRYVTTRPLHDPRGWFARLRDTHLTRLAEARPPEFSTLARHNWALASAAHTRAVRLAEWYETDAALVMIAEARLHIALVTGLLTRTYFRNAADAVKRTGVAGADMQELSTILKEHAEELAARGRPVDGNLGALFE